MEIDKHEIRSISPLVSNVIASSAIRGFVCKVITTKYRKVCITQKKEDQTLAIWICVFQLGNGR